MTVPADLANRALDAIGAAVQPISDLEDGTREAEVAVRHYMPVLKQLFRAAHWNFARRREPMILLNDATGATTAAQIAQNLPQTVGTGTTGMYPWLYEYAWPPDAMKARFVPATWQQPTNSVPPTGGTSLTGPIGVREFPSPFVVTVDVIPPLQGVPVNWAASPLLDGIQGSGRAQQSVILTNQVNASLVYTALILEPDEWDPLFQQAFVSTLASHLALPLLTQRRDALAIRDEQIKVARAAIEQARLTDGNEGWFTNDHTPDWLRARQSGPRWSSQQGGPIGGLWNGWSAMSFCDGSSY